MSLASKKNCFFIQDPFWLNHRNTVKTIALPVWCRHLASIFFVLPQTRIEQARAWLLNVRYSPGPDHEKQFFCHRVNLHSTLSSPKRQPQIHYLMGTHPAGAGFYLNSPSFPSSDELIRGLSASAGGGLFSGTAAAF